MDVTATDDVKAVVNKYKLMNYFHPLNNDFATFKNNLKSLCTKDYIFQIDADEYPHPHFLELLPDILDYNSTIDVFLTPRINTVEGLTEQHIQQWGWHVNDNGWINFPDYQWRIWKNNRKIKWINKVHERLSEFETYSALPQSEEYCLFHPKDIKRQEKQNEFYSKI
jgi:glycosyltransferase involved in cell wall biosynthesis